jgi:DNA-binding Lrp family transcriptional regulator
VARAFAPELEASYSERAVLAWLADRANERGEAWPRLDEGARVTGLAVRSVRRILARLEARGIVERSYLHRGQRGPAGWVVSATTCIVRLAGLLAGAAPLRGVSLALWSRCALSTLERVVLALVVAHANAEGWCWPSFGRLARLAGCSVRAVAGAVAELRRAGVLEGSLVPQGAPLPGGELAREWRLVLRLADGCPKPDPGASIGGPSSMASRTDVHERSAHGASPIEDRPPIAPADPIAAFLLRYAAIAGTDVLGRNAAEIIRQRLADGLSVRDLEHAAAGIAASSWHMAEIGRRTIAAAFGTVDRVKIHADRGRAAGGVPLDLPTPAQEAQEARQNADRLAREATERAEARARLRAIGGGGLASLLARGPAFR